MSSRAGFRHSDCSFVGRARVLPDWHSEVVGTGLGQHSRRVGVGTRKGVLLCVHAQDAEVAWNHEMLWVGIAVPPTNYARTVARAPLDPLLRMSAFM